MKAYWCEVHCPTCGVIIRQVKQSDPCPDCGNVQSINLLYHWKDEVFVHPRAFYKKM